MAATKEVGAALREVQRTLAEGDIMEAPLEAQVLMMHVLGISRAALYAALKEPLPSIAQRRLELAVRRRLAREPLAYITGHREFFGLDLLVDRRVLVPRPETETVLEKAIEIATSSFPGGECAIADVGTGSGAIALALATALPRARIYATDISPDSLEVARLNCRRHDVRGHVTLLLGDLLDPVAAHLDIVVANLPYVADGDLSSLQPEIRLYEPKAALVGGPTGLEAVLRLLGQVGNRNPRPRWVVLELGPGQAAAVAARSRPLVDVASHTIFRDLHGLERGIVLEVRSPDQGPHG